MSMYSVEIYVGRQLTDAEPEALGNQCHPAENGHLHGTLRLAASSPAMAALAAEELMRKLGVEVVVDVPRRVTWAGPE